MTMNWYGSCFWGKKLRYQTFSSKFCITQDLDAVVFEYFIIKYLTAKLHFRDVWLCEDWNFSMPLQSKREFNV